MASRSAAIGRAEDWQSQDLLTASEKLIVALDVPSIEHAKRIVIELDGLVSFFKIGLHLQMVRGTERFIDSLLQENKRVFIDYKHNDIPETLKWGVAASAERRIDFITVQGNGEFTLDALRAAAGARKGGLPKIFFVTVLTSLGDADLQALGIGRTVDEMVRDRVEMVLEVGLDGVIASGRDLPLIRRIAPPDRLLIATPGIRPAGAGADDHKRAATPGQAIGAGTDYLVVGRPIVKSDNPRQAAETIVGEIADAMI